LAVAAVLLPAPAAVANPASCTNGVLPVSLGPGLPANQQVATRLCVPAGRTPDTVQLLVHGCLYDGRYWDFPDPPGGPHRYSFVPQAVAARYATLSFDMLGTGQSSHPPSSDATVDAGVWVIHQVVQALRAGRFADALGPVAFTNVLEVSWSFGTFFSWLE